MYKYDHLNQLCSGLIHHGCTKTLCHALLKGALPPSKVSEDLEGMVCVIDNILSVLKGTSRKQAVSKLLM